MGGSDFKPELRSLGERAGLAPQAGTSTVGGRHCWVKDNIFGTDLLPGLLLRWQQSGQGWRALVVVAIPFSDGLVMRWYSVRDIKQA